MLRSSPPTARSCRHPGSLLGIEGPQDSTDLTTSKPTLTGVDQTGSVVELDFDKSIAAKNMKC